MGVGEIEGELTVVLYRTLDYKQKQKIVSLSDHASSW